MGESRNMDGALRIKEINAAREKLGEPVYLGSDEKIKESFEYDLCVSLVLNDGYDEKKNEIIFAIAAAAIRQEEEKQRKIREEQIKRSKCERVIEGNDMLQFNLQEMRVPATCDKVTVILKHTGTMPANVMGHNWVLTDTADFMPVAQAGGAAGADNNYVPVGDQRVIAATTVIGGGEETSVTFSIENLTAGDSYTFFCSFPGHYAIMKGSFKIIQ